MTYAYDLLGRMTGASQTGHALSFSYDALGRNLTQTGPHGTAASAWDLAGRRTRLTWPGTGLFVDYDYLVTGEMTRIRENGATAGAGVLATYAYDDLGRRISLTRGNGTVTTYAYDQASRLEHLVQDLSGTSNDLTLGFTHNPAGQIVANTRSNDAFSFAPTNGAGFDTHDGLNQIVTRTGATAAHDARGNMTSDGFRPFAYSSENLLTGSSAPGGSTITMGLSYDPMMRLYQLSSLARFGYDGIDMIAEYEDNGALRHRYVHGAAIGRGRALTGRNAGFGLISKD